MISPLLLTLWTHDHGITLDHDNVTIWRADGETPTTKVLNWARTHRNGLVAALDPHPAFCWKCPPDMQDYVDRYDMLGRPWCHSCWALHLLDHADIGHDTPTREEVLADALAQAIVADLTELPHDH